MANLAGVVQQLRKERDQTARTAERLDAALAALNGGSYRRRTGTRSRMSKAARARIAAAQRARWAKVRRNAGQKQKVSSPGEFHPEALSELYMSLSAHTAPTMEPRRTPICQ
jgi:hypothetical protein